MSKICFAKLVAALWLAGVAAIGAAAFPAERWRTDSSEHFVYSYTEQSADLVDRAKEIAESCYPILAEYFGVDFGITKINLAFSDNQDYGNGAAYYDMPLVRIDSRKVDNPFRGETDWLRTVISHELSHLFSCKVLSVGIYFDLSVGRSALPAGHQIGADAAFGGNVFPQWLIEGLAQMGSRRMAADDFDASRRMVLGDALRSGRLLSLRAMERFEGTSRDYELAYNQGFSFLAYLDDRWPAVGMGKLCKSVRERGVAGGFAACYGLDLDHLYRDWRDALAAELPAAAAAAPAAERLSDRTGPMVVELACAADGRFVVANWGNDYQRYNLWERQGKDYRLIDRELGAFLSYDVRSGSLWYLKKVYNWKFGNESYDLFRRDANGSVARLTDGGRCLAFDQRRGTVVYAEYGGGSTWVRQWEPGKPSYVLARFDRGEAVYALSIVDAHRVLATVGRGGHSQAVLLADGEPTYLWPDRSVLQAVAAGDGRVVVNSDAEGSPQLYWAELADAQGSWHPLPREPAGARFPAVEERGGATLVSYARYAGGSFCLVRAADPFADRSVAAPRAAPPVRTPVPAAPTPTPTPAPTPTPPAVDPDKRQGNPQPSAEPAQRSGMDPSYGQSKLQANMKPTPVVLVPVPLVLDFESKRDKSGAEGLTASAGVGFDAVSAGGDTEFSAMVYADKGLGGLSNFGPDFDVYLQLRFNHGAFRDIITYEIYMPTWLNPQNGYQSSRSIGKYDLQVGYQLDSVNTLSLLGEVLQSTDSSYRIISQIYYWVGYGLIWEAGQDTFSRFDPAGLGQSGFDWKFSARGYHANGDPDYYTVHDWTDEHDTAQFDAALTLRALGEGSRAFVALKLAAEQGLGGVDGSRATPSYLRAMGGAGDFSGYPASYANFEGLYWASLVFKCNPFVDTLRPTEWYDRLRLALKASVGWGQYFSTASYRLTAAVPVSAQASLSWDFYAYANRASTLSIAYAMEFNDFTAGELGPLALPFRIYVSFDL